MISWLHLLWILPISFLINFLLISFMIGSGSNIREREAYEEGIEEGKRIALEALQKRKEE